MIWYDKWLQERDLDWFPRMQAMSLTIDEGESEQNELRNLQEKLESTTTLVYTLSQQLVELKEQVLSRTLSWGMGMGNYSHILFSTTTLVYTLSQQLVELKEQVLSRTLSWGVGMGNYSHILFSTTTLVYTLSQQLVELNEQILSCTLP